jgi:hypothetical protein
MMTGWARLDGFLRTDPQDIDCDAVMEILHVYAELAETDPDEARRRHPGVAAHLGVCDPCSSDLDGLLTAINGEL